MSTTNSSIPPFLTLAIRFVHDSGLTDIFLSDGDDDGGGEDLDEGEDDGEVLDVKKIKDKKGGKGKKGKDDEGEGEAEAPEEEEMDGGGDCDANPEVMPPKYCEDCGYDVGDCQRGDDDPEPLDEGEGGSESQI